MLNYYNRREKTKANKEKPKSDIKEFEMLKNFVL